MMTQPSSINSFAYFFLCQIVTNSARVMGSPGLRSPSAPPEAVPALPFFSYMALYSPHGPVPGAPISRCRPWHTAAGRQPPSSDIQNETLSISSSLSTASFLFQLHSDPGRPAQLQTEYCLPDHLFFLMDQFLKRRCKQWDRVPLRDAAAALLCSAAGAEP